MNEFAGIVWPQRLSSLPYDNHVFLIPQVLPSPIISSNGPGEDKLFRSQSADVEISTEKERLKKMLSEG